MVDKVNNQDAVILGKRKVLSADAFDGKAIRVGDIKDKELKQYFRQLYLDSKEGVSSSDLNNMFIDEKEFAAIYERLEKAAGEDRRLSKKELEEYGFGPTRHKAKKLFKSLMKLANDAPTTTENEAGETIDINMVDRKPRGRDKDALNSHYTKDGVLKYTEKSFDKEGFKGMIRTYYRDGDPEKPSAEERYVDGKLISRKEFREDGTVVDVDINRRDDSPEPETPPPTPPAPQTPSAPPAPVINTPRKESFEYKGKQVEVEYDGEGNTYAYVKNGESLRMVAKRFGIDPKTDPEGYAKLKDLNKGLIKTFKTKYGPAEGFLVGQKIRIPGELSFEEYADDLAVNSREEIGKYSNVVKARREAQARARAEADARAKAEAEAQAQAEQRAPAAPASSDAPTASAAPAAPENAERLDSLAVMTSAQRALLDPRVRKSETMRQDIDSLNLRISKGEHVEYRIEKKDLGRDTLIVSKIGPDTLKRTESVIVYEYGKRREITENNPDGTVSVIKYEDGQWYQVAKYINSNSEKPVEIITRNSDGSSIKNIFSDDSQSKLMRVIFYNPDGTVRTEQEMP